MPELLHRTLRREEQTEYLDLLQAAFGEREIFDRYLEHDPMLGLDDTLVACDGDRLVSSVQIFTRSIQVGGEVLPLGGIGSVATHPDYEHRGIATQVLRRAIAEMERRGMALSLLFTMRTSFYERLDWRRIDHHVWVFRADASERAEAGGRAFERSDLDEVKALHERYSGARALSCVRDDAYWKAQLHFAGSPEERFRIVERDGRLCAYARCMLESGIDRVTEYAYAEGEVETLASLLAQMAPEARPFFVPDADPALGTALRARASQLDAFPLPDAMWRVLDRSRLERLAGSGPSASDEEVLRALVDVPQAVYWPSDRF